jgi:hypothetical protein
MLATTRVQLGLWAVVGVCLVAAGLARERDGALPAAVELAPVGVGLIALLALIARTMPHVRKDQAARRAARRLPRGDRRTVRRAWRHPESVPARLGEVTRRYAAYRARVAYDAAPTLPAVALMQGFLLMQPTAPIGLPLAAVALVLVVALWNNAMAARWQRVETELAGASGDVRT